MKLKKQNPKLIFYFKRTIQLINCSQDLSREKNTKVQVNNVVREYSVWKKGF